MRIYQAVPENLPLFHEFFRRWLLPIQQRHGARLIGRWETDDGRVVAVWEYDDRAAYQRIESAVRKDPDLILAQQHPGPAAADCYLQGGGLHVEHAPPGRGTVSGVTVRPL